MDPFFAYLQHPDLAPALDDGLISTFLTRVDQDLSAPTELRLVLELRGRTWAEQPVWEAWEITARGVQLHVLCLGLVPTMRLQTDHPLIQERQEPWATLRGENLPADSRHLAADLQTFQAGLHPLAGGFQHMVTSEGQGPGFFAVGPI